MDEKSVFMKYFKGSKGNVTALTNTSNSEIDKLNVNVSMKVSH